MVYIGTTHFTHKFGSVWTGAMDCKRPVLGDTGAESDAEDEDFIMGSLELESSDGSTDVEAVLNAEVCH